MQVSVGEPGGEECAQPRARAVLDLVGDTWSLLVVRSLRDGPRRFTEIKREVDGVSQRTTLREAVMPLLGWSVAHLAEIDAARAAYDGRS